MNARLALLVGSALVAVAAPGSAAAPPGLSIAKTADAASVNATDQIGYTIAVGNRSHGAGTNVVVADRLPRNAGLSWSISPATPGCAILRGVLGCVVPLLPAGSTFSVHVVSPTTPSTCGTVTNSAGAGSTNLGTAVSPPSTIAVNCPSLALAKSTPTSSVNAGDTVHYTVTASNTGAGDAYGFRVVDRLPTGLTWSLESTTEPTCFVRDETDGSQTLKCPRLTMPAGGSLSVSVGATTSAANCPSIGNSVSLAADNAPSSASVGPVVVAVNCALPDLVVQAISFGAPPGYPPYTYTVTVANQGAGTANLSGVVVQGYYATAAGTYPTNDPACGSSFNPGTTLAPGATVDLVVGCSAAPPPGDTWLNVQVDAGNTVAESDETNNVGSAALP